MRLPEITRDYPRLPGVERDCAVSAGLHRSEQLVDGRLDLTEVRVLLLQIKRSQQERLGAVAT